MYHLRIPEELGLHETDQMRKLFQLNKTKKRKCRVNFSEESLFRVQTLILDDATHIVIGCNATRIDRRSWPLNNYATVISSINKKYPDIRFVVIVSSEDVTVAEELICLTGNYVKSLAGELSLLESAAAMKRSSMYIGNDSGPMHMAAAAGIPVVEISCHPEGGDIDHANAPERFGPYGVPSRICRPIEPKAPCTDACNESEAHCILNVSVEQVELAVKELYEEVYGDETARS